MAGRVLPYGDTALLVELDDLDEVMSFAQAVRATRAAHPDLVDIVPAERTVLLVTGRTRRGPASDRRTGRPADQLAELHRWVTDLLAAPTSRRPAPRPADPLTIPVRYDGADLDRVCRHTGLSRRELIAAHTRSSWRVAFTGFAPGFGYLVGVEPALVVPRRADPRPRVPAGSVALAGRYCGVYPRSSPGGWQLIGHTEAVLFDPERAEPASLHPGRTVRFVDVDAVGGPDVAAAEGMR